PRTKPAPRGPRPFLGVKAAELRSGLPKGYSCGIAVREVQPQGPAQKGGLQDGDVVLELDGVRFDSIDAFGAAIAQHRPGDQVVFTVLRGGAVLVKVTVTLGRR
ncbi:MAG: PDZ domain-containing protein, partial [Planctomycetota bacterium]